MWRYLLFSPELIWLVLLMIAKMVARLNLQYQGKWDESITHIWWIIPVMSWIIFSIFNGMKVEVPYIHLRMWVSGVVFGHLILITLIESITEQNPGTGTIYILGMIVIFVSLVFTTFFFNQAPT
jgi:hypothetical protein